METIIDQSREHISRAEPLSQAVPNIANRLLRTGHVRKYLSWEPNFGKNVLANGHPNYFCVTEALQVDGNLLGRKQKQLLLASLKTVYFF